MNPLTNTDLAQALFEEAGDALFLFDPDSDVQPLFRLSAEEKQKRLNELYRDFAWLSSLSAFLAIHVPA